MTLLAGGAAWGCASAAAAHAIGGSDAAFVAATAGPAPLPFMYLGAKHMVTGYDHLLFLVGVIFFLVRFRQIAAYVSLFSLGHSLTLMAGVFFKLEVDPYLVDALIGLSVSYKAFDNLDGFKTIVGVRLDPKLAVFCFGLVHGLGLATKLQALKLNPAGLITNLVSFNVGVEVGQIIALTIVLTLMIIWRRSSWFGRTAVVANVLLMTAGFVLAGEQLAGFFSRGGA